MVAIERRNLDYCPIDPLLNKTFALASIFKFDDIPVTIAKAFILGKDEFSPPIFRRLIKELVINTNHKWFTFKAIELACTHVVPPLLKQYQIISVHYFGAVVVAK